MIRREVLNHPGLIEHFDWFNDGDDTIRYLRGINTRMAVLMVDAMERKFHEYLVQLAEKSRT